MQPFLGGRRSAKILPPGDPCRNDTEKNYFASTDSWMSTRQAEGLYCWRRGMGQFLQVNTHHSCNWTTREFFHSFSWPPNHKDAIKPFAKIVFIFVVVSLNDHGDIIQSTCLRTFPCQDRNAQKHETRISLLHAFNMLKLALEFLNCLKLGFRLLSWSTT